MGVKNSILVALGLGVKAKDTYDAATNEAYNEDQQRDYAITTASGWRYGEANPDGDGWGKFDKNTFWNSWKPVIFGGVGSWVAKKLKLNKHLAKIPFIGKELARKWKL